MIVCSVVTVLLPRLLLNKATSSRMNAAPPITQIQGCVYQLSVVSTCTVVVFVVVVVVFSTLAPESGCAQTASEERTKHKKTPERSHKEVNRFIIECFLF